MLIPAAVALIAEDFDTARSFFYSSLLILIVTVALGFATQGLPPVKDARRHLVALIAGYFCLPAMLAVPFYEAVEATRFFNAYFEMLSCLTTTGATLFDPARLTDAVHLYRALVGWLGGFLIWVTAAAVLAPLNLGGFEVTTEVRQRNVVSSAIQIKAAAPGVRFRRSVRQFAPIYIVLTGILWLLLYLAGETNISAISHAMSVMATSGISPDGGLSGGQGGFLAECFILIFFVFALTRQSSIAARNRSELWGLFQDRELRLAIYVAGTISALFFMRHFIGAWEVDQVDDTGGAFAALWGGFFTIMSFLTTTGFVSDFWGEARSWSGLPTPGLVLVGLALMGGGVATTAGGVKLLRVYALYKHGQREIGKLVYPNSVASGGNMGRRIRREGAYIAWVFFMLFILSIAAVMLALSATGIEFENAFVLASSALSTTGPLAAYGASQPIVFAALTDAAKVIYGAAMILGRLETLVLLALFNPSFWRI